MDSFNLVNGISLGGVLIALVALIVQWSSLKKQMKLQNFMEYTKRYQEVILNFPESVNDDTFKLENPGNGYDYERLMR